MSTKRALVVDDSKSARVVLSRMLEKYSITVDTAGSAEAALEQIKTSRPDVIFMDHLMPGMDGLQAVKTLKADPDTASIPVVMYTSQEGELYAGTAKALGAAGVLPKTVRPIDVTRVLYQLELLPNRRDSRPPVLQPVPVEEETQPSVTPAASDAAQPADIPQARGSLEHGWVEARLAENSAELRRFFVSALEVHGKRLLDELKPREPEPALPIVDLPEEEPVPSARPWKIALAVCLAVLVGLSILNWRTVQESAQAVRARAALERQVASMQADVARLEQALKSASSAETGQLPADPGRVEVLQVPYGEAPLAGARLDALRELVAALEASAFAGTLTISSVAGEFCLVGSPEGGYSQAPAELEANRCDLRGNPLQDSFGPIARVPLALANLAASTRQRTENRLRVVIANGSEDLSTQPYPAGEGVTAGQWNAVALANNRLEISIDPD
ncbi:MAG: response regulator [Steroidobacteraceae bacterium]